MMGIDIGQVAEKSQKSLENIQHNNKIQGLLIHCLQRKLTIKLNSIMPSFLSSCKREEVRHSGKSQN